MLSFSNGPLVVGFNGPPKAGKDTIANRLQERLDGLTDLPIHRIALAATMRDGAFAILGMSGGDKFYNEVKDKPLEVLGGATFRRFMIDMSESFVKQVYGRDFWSRLMYHRNRMWWDTIPSILLVTDIGFDEEVSFLCNHSTSYLGVNVDRPDCDFSTDSRNWCWSQNAGGVDLALTNDGTIDEAVDEVLRIMSKLGWPVL